MITKLSSAGYASNNSKSQPAFQGGRLNVIKYALNPLKKVSQTTLLNRLGLDADILQHESEMGIMNPVLDVNKPLNRHKAGFLYRLVHKFHIESFKTFFQNAKENRQLVYDMYYKVKYPTSTHKLIAMTDSYSLRETNQIYELMNQDKSKLNLAKKLLKTFKKGTSVSLPAQELITILSGDNCKILNKKYSKVEEFIAKQRENEDFDVRRLPALLELFAKGCK